jgi:glycosyltransferase involved in cell wall biosynthesis
MTKRILMIAYHYPPARGSSGLQRTLSFTKYLSGFGWEPIVLTANARAYPEVSDDQLGDIPSSINVKRAFALDSAKHLSIAGRYLQCTALPDRWVSWSAAAVADGLGLIRKYKPDILWSTYPIATAHLIGLALHRLTRIPWVADFRDPMTEVDPITGRDHPHDPKLWRARRWIESRTVKACTRAVFVTRGSRQIHAQRYAGLPESHWSVISNGYDEESFAGLKQSRPCRAATDGRLVLLHSGVLYPTPDRDPSAFFAAVRQLKHDGRLLPADVKVILRATGHDDRYRKQIREHGIEDVVFLEPAVGYRQALAEMLSADGLLLFQGYTSNPAIPAKFYEYLRARRPILALVDANGDTAQSLRDAAVGRIVPLDSAARIATGLVDFLQGIRRGSEPVASDDEIRRHSRESKSEELAAVLDSVAGMAPASLESDQQTVRA